MSNKLQNYIYLDHAATTPVLPEVAKVINECLVKYFGNASEIHLPGREAKKIIEKSRHMIASIMGASDGEIIFTGSGTESNNLAIFGTAEANIKKGNHIITSEIEHPAAAIPFKMLAKRGFKVTFVPVDRFGMVDASDIKKALSKKTILVSVMHANNIVGTVQPIEEIGAILKQEGILFHTDAVQTFCNLKTGVNRLGVDMLSLSAHKIYGPKGVGALYIRKGTKIMPYIYGGGQEKGRRSGTENTAGIAGLAKAAQIAAAGLEDKIKYLTDMREYIKNSVLARIDDVLFNGHPEKRLPGNCNFSFRFIEGEAMVLRLDAAGVAVSSGSACSTSSTKPSHTLVSMGLTKEDAAGSLRITHGFENTYSQVDYFLENLEKTVTDLRKISPLKKGQ
ncbi:MAG: cysteine desulfurase [Actinobacteria bacterium]|nr:cysteine desulfurase [Actinomycetota bacterium]